MGIPNYFIHIVRNHNAIIKKFKSNIININNLYIDSNSIIYDSVNNINLTNNYEDLIINSVYNTILSYIKLIKPSNKIYIAFDGVAPVAKLEQQRDRRYKNWYVNNYINMHGSEYEKEKVNNKWNTTAITPGTKFMEKLNKKIKFKFNNNFHQDYYCHKNLEIILSTSDEPGEGEHKIFKYIRDNSEYHKDTKTIVYGLDADLIMLSLLHTNISKNIYLFRETPYFINAIDNTLLPNENYLLDIYQFTEIIIESMTENKINNNSDYIKDYVLMCFFLGNDFMPHFPAINIRTDGIEKLLTNYKYIFNNTKELLIVNNKINWKNLKKFIKILSENEEKFIMQENNKREILENKLKKKSFNSCEEELMSLPLLDRKIEYYINAGDKAWEHRYYSELFYVEINNSRKQQICINYLQALEWTFNYYIDDCYDWRWYYKYSYAPLLVDLYEYIPYFDTTFIEKKEKNPILPLTQLIYVLPRNSLDLLPENLYKSIIIKYNDKYRLNNNVLYAYCRYFWESHVILPELNINEIENHVINTKNQ